MQSIIASLLAILANLLPDCPRSHMDDCASTIETLKGFEIIFTEGLDTADTHAALYDSIEDAETLIEDVQHWIAETEAEAEAWAAQWEIATGMA